MRSLTYILTIFVIFVGCSPEVAPQEQCTVVSNDGSATIHCPDGTEATISSYVTSTHDGGGATLDAGVAEDSATVMDAASSDATIPDAAAEFDGAEDDAFVAADANSASEDAAGADAYQEMILYGDYTILNSLDVLALSGYTKIVGNLSIIGAIVTLQGLESLEEIEGSLSIESQTLPNLRGLDSLRTVGNELVITQIPSIEGLENLRRVLGGLNISYTELRTIPLLNLRAVSGSFFFIRNNPHLPNCLVQELLTRVENREGIMVEMYSVENNNDPCDEGYCSGGTCAEDCAQPEFYVCL